MMRTLAWPGLLGIALVGCGEFAGLDTDGDGDTDSDASTSNTSALPTTAGTGGSSATSEVSTTSVETGGSTSVADASSSGGEPTFSVGGVVSGLNGSITLQNNGGDDLTLDADGSFTFETGLVDGETYAVSASEVPGVQLCRIDRAEGRVADDVSDVRVRCGNKAVFEGRTQELGLEPWLTDGTELGTYLLADVNSGAAGSDPVFLAGMGGRLVFSARMNSTGRELWSTSGNAAGTAMLAEISAGAMDSGARVIGVLDGLLYLHVRGAVWVTDGQPGGVMEQFFDPEPTTESSVVGGVAAGNYLVFVAQVRGDREPWVTDGTQDGTMMLGDLNPAGSSEPEFFGRALGGLVYFSATSQDGREVWVTDGTPEGTTQVLDAQPGVIGSDPVISGWLGDRVLFSANVPKLFREPFISDGTAVGTVLLGNLNAVVGSDPVGFTPLGDVAVFAANDGTTGRELWVTDGTPGGTQLVLDIDEGIVAGFDQGALYRPANPNPEDDPWAVFTANDGVAGLELWRTDGSTEGTSLVLDAWAGAAGAIPHGFLPVGPDLTLFLARTAEEGCEPFVTDGTVKGTVALPPLYPGPADGCD